MNKSILNLKSSLHSADLVALNYANANYKGQGIASIIKNEADSEKGIPVYDIKTLAPNGNIYIIHILRSNNSVLSSSISENSPNNALVISNSNQSSKNTPSSNASNNITTQNNLNSTSSNAASNNSSSDSKDAPDHSLNYRCIKTINSFFKVITYKMI